MSDPTLNELDDVVKELQAKEELGDKEALMCPRVVEAIESHIEQRRSDQVNHPSHYTQSSIEVIDILDSILSSQPKLNPYEGFLLGNIIKYLSRLTLKSKPIQDANKAKWYLNKLIEQLTKGENDEC